MPENRIEFKIITDANKHDAHLEAMTLDVAKAFLELIKSLTGIVQNTPSNKDLKIRVENGTVTCGIDGEETVVIEKELSEIIKSNSTNAALVKPWRDLQTLISSNGLEYKAVYYTSSGESVSILESLKYSPKKFRVKTIRKPPLNTHIEFITGKLIAVGGKSPNIHVETDDNRILIIACEEVQTAKAKAFLYNQILLTAWVNNKGLMLCDTFYNTQLQYFNELKTSIEYINSAEDEIDSLKRIHYESKKYLKEERYGVFRKFMRLFSNPNADIGAVKTILLITDPFKQNERLKDIIDSLNKMFSEKMNRLNKKRLNGKEIY